MSDSMVAWKPRIGAARGGGDSRRLGIRHRLEERAARSFSAWVTRRWSEVSPIPRRGRFAIRSSEVASCGFASTLRYAVASRISARS